MSTRIRELEGLRGVAAVGVALFHIHPQGTFWMGSFVDLFFVLSGFLITSILLGLERWDAATLRNFWMRRILRIWPLYYLTLAAVLVLWFAWQIRHGQPLTGFSGFWESVVFLHYLAGDFSTLPPGVNYLWWFAHSWCVAVEEQFYLMWVLVLWAFRHRPVVCAAVLIAFEGIIVWARVHTDWPPYLLFTRGDGLVVGCLMALARHALVSGRVSPALAVRLRFVPHAVFCAGIVLLAPYLVEGYRGGNVAGPGQYDVLPLVFALTYASLLGVLLARDLPLLNGFMTSAPLVYLGSLSYAIYIFHLPIQKLLDRFHDAGVLEPRWLVEGIYWVVVIGLAAAARKLLETPMEKVKSRYPLRPPRAAPRAFTPGLARDPS